MIIGRGKSGWIDLTDSLIPASSGMHVVTRVNNHELIWLILAQTSGPTQPMILPHNILALENL